MYKRLIYKRIFNRLNGPCKFIQVLAGPRQVGKSTLIHQILKELDIPSHYATADAAGGSNASQADWLRQNWDLARFKYDDSKAFILVLDEIQKIKDWSNWVKLLWEEDQNLGREIKIVLLGSAPLLLQKGLSESLTGRFEKIVMTHWSFAEMRDAFGVSLDEYIYFGGYPGANSFMDDEARWDDYVRDAIIEPTISRDILQLERVMKPALLKNLFELGCAYSGQILSFQKIMGQLQDAGNTTTLSHYLRLLGHAGLITGISKYAGSIVHKRGSSPKLQVYNMALVAAQNFKTFKEIRESPDIWGRYFESAVAQHLLNQSLDGEFEVFYWTKNKYEVDFVLQRGSDLIALEVKSNAKMMALPGLSEFSKDQTVKRALKIGYGGIEMEDFLMSDVRDYF